MTTVEPETLPTGPSPDGADAPYWEGLRQGLVRLPRCGSCATWLSLGQVLCPNCYSFEIQWEDVSATGTVYTWIRSQRAFISELDVPPPYVTVLVEFDGAPVRVLGILLDGPDAPVSIGSRVTGTVVQPANAEWPVLRWSLEAGA